MSRRKYRKRYRQEHYPGPFEYRDPLEDALYSELSYYGEYMPKRKAHTFKSKSMLEISSLVRDRLYHYANAVKGEISGLGKVHVCEGVVKLVDIVLLPQECNPAATTLTEEGLSKFIYELAKAGKRVEDWKLWWHSHVDFAVFWSGTDESTIKKLSKTSNIYALCVNQFGHMLACEGTNGRMRELEVHGLPGSMRDKRRCVAEARKLVKDTPVVTRRHKYTEKFKTASTSSLLLPFLPETEMQYIPSVQNACAVIGSEHDDAWKSYRDEHIYGHTY